MDFVPTVFVSSLVVLLLAISVIDATSLRIPNWSTAMLFVVGVAFTVNENADQLASHLAAALGAYAFMAVLSAFYRHARGFDGLGLGDAKLLGAFGVWVGPLWIAPIVFGASLMAIAFVLLRKTFAGTAINSVVPFGPFLSASFLFCWWVDNSGIILLRGLA